MAKRVSRVDEFAAKFRALIEQAERDTPEFAQIAFDQAQEWYPNAHKVCLDLSEKYDVYFTKVMGIMAAMSIQTRWEKNLADTEKFLRGDVVSGLPIRVKKAHEVMGIKHGHDVDEIMRVLNGPKIQCFFDNILLRNRSKRSTIDTWMCKIIDHEAGIKGADYRDAETACNMVADERKIQRPAMQAWMWILVRGKAD